MKLKTKKRLNRFEEGRRRDRNLPPVVIPKTIPARSERQWRTFWDNCAKMKVLREKLATKGRRVEWVVVPDKSKPLTIGEARKLAKRKK